MSVKTLPDLLNQSVKRFPRKTALIFQGVRYTYRELDEQTDRLAHELIQRGCVPGEKIAVCSWNSPGLVLSLFAIWKMGGIVVDINPSLKPEEISHILHQCQVKTLISEEIQKSLLEQVLNKLEFPISILFTNEWEGGRMGEWENRHPICHSPLPPLPSHSLGIRWEPSTRPSSLACINYTSGTTGIPKGVLLPPENLIRNAELNIKYFRISDKDRTSLVLPLFFGMNKIFLLAHLMVGATVLLERNFTSPNSVLASMEAEQITGLSAVPAIYHMLLSRGDVQRYSLASLRYFRIGAGQVTSEMIQKLHRVFPQVDIYLTYGLTEVGLVTVLSPEKLLEKWGSCGRIIPEVRVTLSFQHDESENRRTGEVVIQCVHGAKGYYRNEEETRNVFREDGIHTGDLGWIDEEGYLYLIGRRKEIIKSGSENIHPREIESVLNSHEGVAECAVVGIPDKWLGEAIKAYVVPRKGVHLDPEQILKFCNGRLSPIKRPKHLVICDELPKTETGKIKRGELKELMNTE